MSDHRQIVVKSKDTASVVRTQYRTDSELAGILSFSLERGRDNWTDVHRLMMLSILPEVVKREPLDKPFSCRVIPFKLSALSQDNLVVDVDSQTVDGVGFEKFISDHK